MSSPRVWPSIVLAIFGPLVAQIVAGVVVVIVATVSMVMLDPSRVEATDPATFTLPPLLLALMAGVAMLGLSGVTLAAGWESPVPVLDRLGLVRGRFRWAALLPITVFGVALAQTSGGIGVAVFGAEAFAFLDPMLGSISDAGPFALLAIGIAVAVGPGFAEELLFRGYLQRRLLTRWSPLVAVGLSSVLFAAAHVHPLHVLVVLPLGAWLGVLAWRSESVLPGMVVHTANNTLAIGLTAMPLPIDDVSMLAVSAPVMVLAGAASLAMEPRLRPSWPTSPGHQMPLGTSPEPNHP